MQKQEIMQVHPNNGNGTRCTLHSCSGDETFSPSMKIEQNREFSMDDFSICVMILDYHYHHVMVIIMEAQRK